MKPMDTHYSYDEQMRWLHEHLPDMHFVSNATDVTICAVYMHNDPQGEKWLRMNAILPDCFGGTLVGPSSNWSGSDGAMPTYQSFTFRTRDLLDEARRVLPLPEGMGAV